jgi:putative methanogenesis marker protein 12
MYIGIDHGTSSIRFAGGSGVWKISREDARDFCWRDLSRVCPLSDIEGIALTYSMGDNFSAITLLQNLENRGLVSREGAGKHVGGGTRVFDEICASDIPAVAIPGLHRGSPTDIRFKAYSHQASPEKIGIAYEVCHRLGPDVIVSDVSSNTVTVLVSGGRITGAIDACIFAPGMIHGAVDLDAIRRIDSQEMTANEAFQHAGVMYSLPAHERERTIALFAAMECAALRLLNPDARIAVAGTLAPVIAGEAGRLLGLPVAVYDEWCASRGLARIAGDVFSGASRILGIDVNL